MKTKDYIKALSLSNPQIRFASAEEHYRIYYEFVRSLMHEEGALHPQDYRGQEAVNIVCSQHPVGVEEYLSDPKGWEKKQRLYTAEWVEFLNRERLPAKEIDVCSIVNQKVFDALCRQEGLESLRIKWLRCKQIEEIVRLKNLKKLFFGRASSLTDLSPLAKLENLEVLILGETKKIVDYSPLAALKKLKVLGICTYLYGTVGVKDLGFISEMPSLEYVDFVDVRLVGG